MVTQTNERRLGRAFVNGFRASLLRENSERIIELLEAERAPASDETAHAAV